MLGIRGSKLIITSTMAASMISGCGTFQLASGAIPLSTKTPQQQQLDALTCKDQVNIESNSADRQVGDFLLGLTIVGAPVAFELDKQKQREVFKSCMEARGYKVLPPNDDGKNSGSAETDRGLSPASPKSTSLPQTVQMAPLAGPNDSSSVQPRDTAAQLRKLKELRDQGLITQDEYDQKRQKIIDGL